MEDETLNNILNLLQSSNSNQNTNNNANNNLDLQNLLIKFLLSGGLNNFLKPNTPEKTRTIDLTNYKRLD